MRVPRRIRARRVRAFTLVEMLLAMTIMAVVLSLFLQMTNQVFQVYRTSKQQIEAAKKANAVIGSIEGDLNAMVSRTGPSIFVDPVNNVLTFAVISRGPNNVASSRFMAVSYSFINNEVKRSATPLLWNDPDFATTMTTLPEPQNDPNAIIIAQGVVGFRIDLVLDNGQQIPMSTIGTIPTAITTRKYGPSSQFLGIVFASGTADPNSPHVRATSLSVAAIDDQNLAMLTSMGRLNALTATFAATGTTRPPELWNNEIVSNANSYPKPVISALYVGSELFSFQ